MSLLELCSSGWPSNLWQSPCLRCAQCLASHLQVDSRLSSSFKALRVAGSTLEGGKGVGGGGGGKGPEEGWAGCSHYCRPTTVPRGFTCTGSITPSVQRQDFPSGHPRGYVCHFLSPTAELRGSRTQGWCPIYIFRHPLNTPFPGPNIFYFSHFSPCLLRGCL